MTYLAAQDRRQVRDDEKGWDQHGGGTEKDAQHARIRKHPHPFTQAGARSVHGREASDQEARDHGQRGEDPHGAAPSQRLADEDAERKARHQRQRTAARDDGQRPGAMRIVAEQTRGAVSVRLVGSRTEGGDHATARHNEEARSGGLHYHADDEDHHPAREENPAIPAAGQRGDCRRSDRIHQREQRGQLAGRAERHVQVGGDLRQQSGEHEAVHPEGERPDGENQQVYSP